jgi:hypothetical protein
MTPRIDAYMLVTDEPQTWLDAAAASLHHPCIHLQIVHTSKSIPMGEDWERCIAASGCALLTFVDPDNLYDPAAFIALADALDAQPRAVLGYTDEAIICANATPLGVRRYAYSRFHHHQRADHVHSCVTYRRSAAMECIDALDGISRYPDWALSLSLAQRGQIVHLPLIGRQWRQHPKQAHLTLDAEEATRIRNFTKRNSRASN